jgi:hypothetical protein
MVYLLESLFIFKTRDTVPLKLCVLAEMIDHTFLVPPTLMQQSDTHRWASPFSSFSPFANG